MSKRARQRRNQRIAEIAARHLLETFGFVRSRILLDCYAAGMTPREARDYSAAIMTYLALGVSNFEGNRSNTLVTWEPRGEKPRNTFTRQAASMSWDYCEVNPLGPAGIERVFENIAAVLDQLPPGEARIARHETRKKR